MKRFGSQTRVTLKESDYELISRPDKGVVILRRKSDNIAEVWYANNNHAGYTIQIGRWGYEFGMDCQSIKPPIKKP